MRRWVLVAALITSGCAHTAARSPSTTPPPPKATVAETASSYGWSLLSRRCQGCHALPDPRKHSRERWVKGIEKMRGRFALTPADWDTLLAMVPADTLAPTP